MGVSGMNDVIKAMKERRSIRAFKPDMPAKEDLDQIIEAGLYAASGMGKQSPIILAVTNSDLIDKLRIDNRNIMGMDESYDPFYGAPALLIVLADKNCFTGIYDGSLRLDSSDIVERYNLYSREAVFDDTLDVIKRSLLE